MREKHTLVIALMLMTALMFVVTRQARQREGALHQSLDACRDSLRDAEYEAEQWHDIFELCRRHQQLPTLPTER